MKFLARPRPNFSLIDNESKPKPAMPERIDKTRTRDFDASEVLVLPDAKTGSMSGGRSSIGSIEVRASVGSKAVRIEANHIQHLLSKNESGSLLGDLDNVQVALALVRASHHAAECNGEDAGDNIALGDLSLKGAAKKPTKKVTLITEDSVAAGGSENKLPLMPTKPATTKRSRPAKPHPGRKLKPPSEREKKRVPQSSSTSSLFASSSISAPDVDALLLGMATLLARMIDDARNAKAAEKELFNPGGLSSELVDSARVYSFLRECFVTAKWSPECNIIALALLIRLVTCVPDRVSLNKDNWAPLMLTALMIAQKTWDDIPLSNTDFPKLWHRVCINTKCREDGLSIGQVNKMWVDFLNLLHFDVHISPRTYFLFFFELRDMANPDAAAAGDDQSALRQPMSLKQAAMMEADSARLWPPKREATRPSGRPVDDLHVVQLVPGRAVLS